MRKEWLWGAVGLALGATLFGAVEANAQSPTAGPIVLRTNTVRARTIDRVFAYLSLTNPAAAVIPDHAEEASYRALLAIDSAIDNNWLVDIPISLGRLIRYEPKSAAELSQMVVDTIHAQPKGAPGIGFCAIKSGIGCINIAIAEEEEFYMRGVPDSPLTKAMSSGRVIPINKAAAFIIGGALAEAKPAEALKRDPLDAFNSKALAPLCVNNVSTPNSLDADTCAKAGMGYALARKGYIAKR